MDKPGHDAQQDGPALPPRPTPPRPLPPRDSDCCGSDCPLCVFTLYDRELERWREQVEAIRQGQRA